MVKYIAQHKLTSIFLFFCIMHVVIWTVCPLFIRHTLPSDLLEAVTWGHQFSWGYDKNPWLPGLLAHLGLMLGGSSGIGIYFIQSIIVVLGLWAVWRLVSLLSTPIYGFIAACMLEACVPYTVEVQIYNDNYLLIGLLPVVALCFFHAIKSNKFSQWALAAVLLACATMGKYDAMLLGIAVAAYCLISKNRHKYFSSYKIYAAFLIYILICLPNMVWLFLHHLSSLNYAFAQRGNMFQQTYFASLISVFSFIKDAAVMLLLPIFIACLALSWRRSDERLTSTMYQASNDEKLFLTCVTLGPILFLLITALGLGLSLHREWSTCFIGLIGGWLLVMFQPHVSARSLRRFIYSVFALLVIWPIGYLTLSFTHDVGNLPGPEMAALATRLWHAHFHTRLRYVAGDRYTAGVVGAYSTDQPAVWMEWNSQVAPWIDRADLHCQGAVFIQDSGHSVQQFFKGMVFPDFVLKEFPQLITLPPITVPWYRNHTKQPDLKVIIGLLPPQASCL